MKPDLSKLTNEVEVSWKKGEVKRTLTKNEIPTIPKGINLIPWECMMLSRLNCVPGEVGELVLAFPPGGSPAELIPHVHGGGRIITVLAGIGIFSCERNGTWEDIVLEVGDQVRFPAGVNHTFVGKDGQALLVHAYHLPYFAPDDPKAITYADKTHSKEYPKWDPKEFFPEILV